MNGLFQRGLVLGGCLFEGSNLRSDRFWHAQLLMALFRRLSSGLGQQVNGGIEEGRINYMEITILVMQYMRC